MGNTLTYQRRGPAEVGMNTQHAGCSAGVVCVPVPVPGRTQGNLPLLWQKINLAARGRCLCTQAALAKPLTTARSHPGDARSYLTLWRADADLSGLHKLNTIDFCLDCNSKTFREGRQALQRRVLLILDKSEQLTDAVCILIHLRLGLFLAYFAF